MTTSQTPAPKTLRSDVHRPSQIVPTDYEFQFRFYLGGWYKRQPIQKIHFDKLEACRKFGSLANVHDSYDQCDVCGARYTDGEVWLHKPTATLITIGHICADKYSLVARDPGFERQMKIARRNAARIWSEYQRADRARDAISSIPGLREALDVCLSAENEEAYQIYRRCLNVGYAPWHSQQTRIQQIAAEILNPSPVVQAAPVPAPAPMPAPVPQTSQPQPQSASQPSAGKTKIPAPLGKKIRITGLVYSTKFQDTMYGTQRKMLVEVTDNAGGTYRVYGTIPQSIWDAAEKRFGRHTDDYMSALRGCAVSFLATEITPSRDDVSFAFFSRPTQGQLL